MKAEIIIMDKNNNIVDRKYNVYGYQNCDKVHLFDKENNEFTIDGRIQNDIDYNTGLIILN